MIKLISWEEISEIWKKNLWPSRKSPIESTSAMCFLEGFNMQNMKNTPTFFGFLINGKIVGVNSGHMCIDNNYRSRGLWVNSNYRNQGIGTQLLLSTIDQGKDEGAEYVWSFPRYSSWSTYQNAGFKISSSWIASETSESNAYCIKKFD